MESIKKISLFLGALCLVLFMSFGFEYDFGYHYPESNKCEFPNGQKRVYVHWIKILNTTTSTFCDFSTSRRHYLDEDTAKENLCNCE
jgi:hypothetical protein